MNHGLGDIAMSIVSVCSIRYMHVLAMVLQPKNMGLYILFDLATA